MLSSSRKGRDSHFTSFTRNALVMIQQASLGEPGFWVQCQSIYSYSSSSWSTGGIFSCVRRWSCHWGTSHRCFSSGPTIVLHHTCCPFEYLTIHTHMFQEFWGSFFEPVKKCRLEQELQQALKKDHNVPKPLWSIRHKLFTHLVGSSDDPNILEVGIQVLEYKW